MALLYLILVSLIANVLMVSAAGKVTLIYTDNEYVGVYGSCHNDNDGTGDLLEMIYVAEPVVCSSYPQFYCKGQPINVDVNPGTAYHPARDIKSVACFKK